MSLALDSNLPSGTVIGGRFEVLRLRGRGGMGSVYEAEDRTLSRPVALKLLSVASQEAKARFATEAHAASRISSRYAAGIFDFGEDPDHGHYMVMELLDGTSLDELLDERALTPSEAASVGADIAEALQAAHEAGVVHRDLKPGNVMLLDAGGVKVVDFGIARVMKPRGHHKPFETKPDVVVGTPAYMSPEAVRGDAVGPASDLYALGVLLFEMLTGQVPFFDEVVASLMVMQLESPPPRMHDVQPALALPDGMEGLVSALLEKDAALRPRSAAEVASTLRAMASGPVRLTKRAQQGLARGAETAILPSPSQPRPPRWRWVLGLSAAGLAALLLTAVGLLVQRGQTRAEPNAATVLAPEPSAQPRQAEPRQTQPRQTQPRQTQPRQTEAEAIAPPPAQAVLTLDVTPADAEVRVDGERVGREAIVQHGQHVVEARAPGHRPERRELTLDGPHTARIVLRRVRRRRNPSRGASLPAKMREW